MSTAYTHPSMKSTVQVDQVVQDYVDHLPQGTLIHARTLHAVSAHSLDMVIVSLLHTPGVLQFGPLHFVKGALPTILTQALFIAGAGSGPASHTAIAHLGLDIDRSSKVHVALGGHSINRQDPLPDLPQVVWHDRGPWRFPLNRVEVALVEVIGFPEHRKQAKTLAKCLAQGSHISFGLVEGVARYEGTW